MSMNVTDTQIKTQSGPNWMVVSIIFMVTTSVSIIVVVVFCLYHRLTVDKMRNENQTRKATSKDEDQARYVQDPTRPKKATSKDEDPARYVQDPTRPKGTNAPNDSTSNMKKNTRKTRMPPRPKKKLENGLNESNMDEKTVDQNKAGYTHKDFDSITDREAKETYINYPTVNCKGQTSEKGAVNKRLKSDSDVKASTSADANGKTDNANLNISGRVNVDDDTDQTTSRNSGESCNRHSTEMSVYENEADLPHCYVNVYNIYSNEHVHLGTTETVNVHSHQNE